MTRTACSAVLLLGLLVALPLGSPARALAPASEFDPAAAVEDVKAAFEKADYNETLRLIARLIALKGDAAAGIDRYELYRLKAESHLKLKQSTNAVAALEEAAKVAKAAMDDKAAADARALVTLVKKSKGLHFTPKVVAGKGGKREPIDITDLKKREEAFDALYAEEKAAARPKVLAADKRKDLPPVAAALTAVAPLKDLEIAATGKDAETKDTIQSLVDRAHKLMARGLDDMVRRTDRIAERANELVQYEVPRANGGYDIRTKRQGLTREDADELKGIIADCKRVVASCKELTAGFTDEVEPFEDLEDQARETGERAHDVLTDNYSRLRS